MFGILCQGSEGHLLECDVEIVVNERVRVDTVASPATQQHAGGCIDDHVAIKVIARHLFKVAVVPPVKRDTSSATHETGYYICSLPDHPSKRHSGSRTAAPASLSAECPRNGYISPRCLAGSRSAQHLSCRALFDEQDTEHREDGGGNPTVLTKGARVNRLVAGVPDRVVLEEVVVASAGDGGVRLIRDGVVGDVHAHATEGHAWRVGPGNPAALGDGVPDGGGVTTLECCHAPGDHRNAGGAACGTTSAV
jgi:hypothetical protein